MTALLVALLLAAPCTAEHGHRGFVRSQAVKRQFMKAHPCPAGPDKGSVRRCAGFEAHHVVPLSCGGEDKAENLIWLTKKQHAKLHQGTICRDICTYPGMDKKHQAASQDLQRVTEGHRWYFGVHDRKKK